MKIFFLVLICWCSESILPLLAQSVNFKWNEETVTPEPTLPAISTNEMSDGSSEAKFSKAECGCVHKGRCADPGLIGPRQTTNERLSTKGLATGSSITISSSVVRIINEPPPGVSCPSETLFCCNIIPEAKPEKRFTCGIRKVNQFPQLSPTPGQAGFGKYPWMTLILNSENGFIAGGSLLDEFTVLTSAHNVQAYAGYRCKSLKVRLGEWDMAIVDKPFPFVEVSVHRVIIHPHFNALSLENDVAVIQLDPSCELAKIENPNINSICLPSSSSFSDVNFNEERCSVAGYGKTENGQTSSTLREVELSVLNGRDCECLLRKTILGAHFMLNQKSFICAGGEPRKDACTKDGGSALVCERPEGHWQVAGIVSWGIGCGEPNVPGVYVNVPTYVDWIKKWMRH